MPLCRMTQLGRRVLHQSLLHVLEPYKTVSYTWVSAAHVLVLLLLSISSHHVTVVWYSHSQQDCNVLMTAEFSFICLICACLCLRSGIRLFCLDRLQRFFVPLPASTICDLKKAGDVHGVRPRPAECCDVNTLTKRKDMSGAPGPVRTERAMQEVINAFINLDVVFEHS